MYWSSAVDTIAVQGAGHCYSDWFLLPLIQDIYVVVLAAVLWTT